MALKWCFCEMLMYKFFYLRLLACYDRDGQYALSLQNFSIKGYSKESCPKKDRTCDFFCPEAWGTLNA